MSASSSSSSSAPVVREQEVHLKGPLGLTYLLFGAKGWIGQITQEIFRTQRPQDRVVLADARAHDAQAVEQQILTHKPDRMISFVGRTHGDGIYTIDYLESKGKLKENITDNLLAPMILLKAAQKHNVHLTYLGTGCLFNYDDKHPLGGDESTGFTEDDAPNFFGSSYSTVKGVTDQLFHVFGNESALNCRIRMCLVPTFDTRNFITKIARYKHVCSVSNSMSFLNQLLPIMLDMSACKEVGTVNLVNPEPISHAQVLERYAAVVDPEFQWAEFSIPDQNKLLAAERSNNLLATRRLREFAPHVLTSHQALEVVLAEMAVKFKNMTQAEKDHLRTKM